MTASAESMVRGSRMQGMGLLLLLAVVLPVLETMAAMMATFLKFFHAIYRRK